MNQALKIPVVAGASLALTTPVGSIVLSGAAPVAVSVAVVIVAVGVAVKIARS